MKTNENDSRQETPIPVQVETGVSAPGERNEAAQADTAQSAQEKVKFCSICNGDYEGYGNNAWPINPGRCCDMCNTVVVTHRIRNVVRGLGAYDAPEWFVKITTN